jgi:hypothetical protein
MFRKKSTSWIDEEIVRVRSAMRLHEVASEEWKLCLLALNDLTRMDTEKNPPVSRDVLAGIGANLLGIFMIIKHESVNVISSKALSFVIKSKI